jgi:hypothetical protein
VYENFCSIGKTLALGSAQNVNENEKKLRDNCVISHFDEQKNTYVFFHCLSLPDRVSYIVDFRYLAQSLIQVPLSIFDFEEQFDFFEFFDFCPLNLE